MLALILLVISLLADDLLDIGEPDADGAGLVNFTNIAAFISGWGSVATALTLNTGLSGVGAALWAVPVGGLPLAGTVIAVTRLLQRQQITTSHSMVDLVGARARSLTGVLPTQMGQVEYSINGQVHAAAAICLPGQAIVPDQVVEIVDVMGTVLVVSERLHAEVALG